MADTITLIAAGLAGVIGGLFLKSYLPGYFGEDDGYVRAFPAARQRAGGRDAGQAARRRKVTSDSFSAKRRYDGPRWATTGHDPADRLWRIPAGTREVGLIRECAV